MTWNRHESFDEKTLLLDSELEYLVNVRNGHLTSSSWWPAMPSKLSKLAVSKTALCDIFKSCRVCKQVFGDVDKDTDTTYCSHPYCDYSATKDYLRLF